jgi:hypothetical protein
MDLESFDVRAISELEDYASRLEELRGIGGQTGSGPS